MKFIKSRIFIYISLVFLALLFTGCPQEEPEEIEEEKEMPEAIGGIERGALEIMRLADLVPVIDKIQEQQVAEETEENQEQNEDENGQQDDEAEPEEQEVFNQRQGQSQEMVTFEETLLAEVLKREEEDEPEVLEERGEEADTPRNAEELWDNVKINVASLHDQWDELEPILIKENVPPDAINQFKEELDTLTQVSVEEDYFGTLVAANQLTEFLPEFMKPFAENNAPIAYELKYHVRNVVLTAAEENYDEAQESLDYMKERVRSLNDDLEEEEAQDTVAELQTSLDNLDRAIEKEELNLIKIKAAVTMENLVEAIDELE